MNAEQRYQASLSKIEARRRKELAREQRKTLEQLIRENKGKPLRVVQSRYSETYEGGYAGDELITRDVDRYTVYLGDVEIAQYDRWPQDVISFINMTFAPRKLKAAKAAVARAKNKLQAAKVKVDEAEKVAASVLVECEWKERR